MTDYEDRINGYNFVMEKTLATIENVRVIPVLKVNGMPRLSWKDTLNDLLST